jgi:hypothetical protein
LAKPDIGGARPNNDNDQHISIPDRFAEEELESCSPRYFAAFTNAVAYTIEVVN